MRGRRQYTLIVGGLAALILATVACATDLKPVEDRIGSVEQSLRSIQSKLASLEGGIGKIAAPAATRRFYVTGVEWKGTTSDKKLAPPSVNPADLSDGYGFKPPGNDPNSPDEWTVATYVWTPGSMAAYQGDKVEMTFFIVNGDEHSVWVEGPDGTEVVQETEMNRGREYELSFTA